MTTINKIKNFFKKPQVIKEETPRVYKSKSDLLECDDVEFKVYGPSVILHSDGSWSGDGHDE